MKIPTRFLWAICSIICASYLQAAEISNASNQHHEDFDNFLKRTFVVADGFDAPNKKLNSKGVHALAHGRVHSLIPVPNSSLFDVLIEHNYFENNARKTIYSRYHQLYNLKLAIGESIQRGQLLGSASQALHENRVTLHERLPSSDVIKGIDIAPFIERHQQLFNPQLESNLILVDQNSYRMRIIKEGKTFAGLDISLGQAQGKKQVQGDNKTPKGMYFITQKYRGQFPGKFGAYFGGHWIKINYPNAYDAEWGVAQNLISREQAENIRKKMVKPFGKPR
ncbi:L,D-transpeptidase [Undibacterium flavidum]|uniref:L,D-transpeptidase n=1 Tax=Undibacterium flavidum TaxID=2762297 RepID=A0ABR6Y7B9_9BURK|nr:L,D-transpeptidase [Undibacterium flavidum]MBC3872516.1 L,D-transpeptidase [Undibacterium flavidum]